MSEPTKVAAFLCPVCTVMHRILSDAVKCCICGKCGEPAVSDSYAKLCLRHNLKGHVRHKQENVRRLRRQLKDQEDSLAECKAELVDLGKAPK